MNLDNSREAVFVAEIDKAIVGYIHAEIYNLLYYETILPLSITEARRFMEKRLEMFLQK